MDNMPFYMVFVQSLPETLILIYMGLVLIDAKPPVIKVLGIALASALLGFFLRSLPLPLGANVFIQIPIITALLWYVCKLPLSMGLISTILGILSVTMAEVIFDALVSLVTGISPPQAMEIPLWRILYPLPEFLFLTLLILWFKHRRINITSLIKPLSMTNRNNLNENVSPIILLAMTVLLVIIAFYCEFYLEGFTHISRQYIIITLFAVSMIAVLLTITLIWKMFYINKQESLMDIQTLNISNLQDMMQIIKAQRHDFINHLQVIYGLLKLGENEQIEDYISSLYKEIQITGDILRLAIPELSAFLLVQSGLAATNNISLEIEQETDLGGLHVPASELIVVVGNLLKNAMEAVTNLEPDQRKVKLKIFEKSKYYVIQTRNHGWIPRELKSKIFEPGFSTKSNAAERGIGLASVKYQVEKYHGMIVVSSHPQKGVRFTVCYPKERGRKSA